MYRLYWKMTIYGHFSIYSIHFGIHLWTVLYLKSCYNEPGYKEVVVYTPQQTVCRGRWGGGGGVWELLRFKKKQKTFSLEALLWGPSNEHPHCMFLWRNKKKKYLRIIHSITSRLLNCLRGKQCCLTDRASKGALWSKSVFYHFSIAF